MTLNSATANVAHASSFRVGQQQFNARFLALVIMDRLICEQFPGAQVPTVPNYPTFRPVKGNGQYELAWMADYMPAIKLTQTV